MSDDDIPVIEVDDDWSFYCVHCKARHWHSPGEGHRLSHCYGSAKDNPYPHGYMIKLRQVSQ